MNFPGQPQGGGMGGGLSEAEQQAAMTKQVRFHRWEAFEDGNGMDGWMG